MQIIHGYSDKHERTPYGVLQERYDAAISLPVRRSLMKLADILAMTTTRAAFMRSALDKLDIKIGNSLATLFLYHAVSFTLAANNCFLFTVHRCIDFPTFAYFVINIASYTRPI